MKQVKPIFKEVAIIGAGLIGGSLALALKRHRIAGRVIGVARRRRTLRLAKKIGAIDIGSQDINNVRHADLIILAMPVNTIISMADKLSRLVKPDSIVTDVGSTKKEIVSKLENLFPNYVGAHPLAGSQKSGIRYACAEMFKDSLCVLTPTPRTKNYALKKITKLWKEVGAEVVLASPQQHDKAISFVSHLPHLVAFSLIDVIPRRYLRLAASGLKDTTRIASSDPHLWQDIFMTNRGPILKALKEYEKRLNRLKGLLLKNDKKGLYRLMTQAKRKRDSLI